MLRERNGPTLWFESIKASTTVTATEAPAYPIERIKLPRNQRMAAPELPPHHPEGLANKRPAWLVSVSSDQEIQMAIDVGVDILDLKDPRRGPLSPASEDLWHAAALAVAATRPEPLGGVLLSAALGESDEALEIADRVPQTFHFAKVGPSRCLTDQRLAMLWQSVQARLGPTIDLVAVSYCDFTDAETLAPEPIFDLAAEMGIRHVLIDTFVKDGRTSFETLGMGRLIEINARAAELGLWWSLAGSARHEHLGLARDGGLTPNCWGVRGDVCENGRTGKMSAQRLRHWKATIDCLNRHRVPAKSTGPSQPG